MSEDTNVTENIIAIKIGETTATVDPELLLEWVKESNANFNAIEKVKTEHKELVTTIVETTKIPKKLVNKFLRARFKESTEEESQAGNVIRQLDEALET